jgi:tripartite-type tricarboxylate transporter receptor subunit TctC
MNVNMKKTALILCMVLMVGLLGACGSSEPAAAAEIFPDQPITLICPWGAGGGTDSVGRALADVAKDLFGQSVVVENKTGGVGVVGMTTSMNAKPDGYTVGLIAIEVVTLPKMGLAPDTFTYENYRPLALLNADPCAITVSADAPWNTLQEFLDYVKENPGEVTVGNAGSGSIWHLGAIGLEEAAGVEFKHIPYSGGANPVVVDLLGGHIDAVAVSPAEVGTHVEAGKLKILGIASEERLDKFPEVPTYKEQGIDLVLGTWRGLAVPKDTPDDVFAILEEKFVEAAKDPKFSDFLANAGLGHVVMGSEDFTAKIQREDTLLDPICTKYLEAAE